MRQVNEAEAGPVFLLHPLGGLRDPEGGLDVRSRAPEAGEGEGAKVFLDALPHAHRLGVHVEDLTSISRVKRARSDREVRAGVHVIPPEELGAGELRVDAAQAFPELLAADEVVALLPETVLVILAVIPTVGHGTVVARQLARQVSGLRGAGDGRHDGFHLGQLAALQEGADLRRVIADEAGGQADDVEDCGALHGGKGVISYWSSAIGQ